MISIDLSPLCTVKPAINNWTQNNPHNMTGTLREADRNVLAPNDNISNLINNNNSKEPPKVAPRRDMK